MQNTINKNQIIELRNVFYEEITNNIEFFTEETIRSGYINKLLEIFGWNISDTSEVVQEKKLGEKHTEKLLSINSTHNKPDYRLQDNGVARMYIDAKNITANYLNNKAIGFQIRSYGWSSNFKISIVSDFEHFTVYDTTFKPDISMENNYKSITFTIDDLIEDIEKYGQFLNKNTVNNQSWDFSELSLDFKSGDTRTLDKEFLNLIGDFRIKLTKGFSISKKYNQNRVDYLTQLTINRLLFLRILEDNGFETSGQILDWYKNSRGFWKQFVNESNNKFSQVYDGALFDTKLPSDIEIDDKYFSNFINSLYGHAPYRFDVIQPEIISEIYDIFLGEEIVEIGSMEFELRNKDISPEGNVPTPPELASLISENTIDLNSIDSLEELYKKKILDPCCGSGSFLVAAFDVLKNHAEKITNNTLNYKTTKDIITNCLYGVDVDPIAIEVIKMTMSIKLILSDYEKPIIPYDKLLSDFGDNFKLGNSIVEKDITNVIKSYNTKEASEQFPTNYEDLYPFIMNKNGGFDYILTNPPYTEPKHYKFTWPETYNYLKKSYFSYTGKTDISMFFLERIYDLINNSGKVGLVIQRRFFSTNYGKKMRNWLSDNGYITTIKEFKENSIFKNRTTYVAIIYGEKKKRNDKVNYYYSLLDLEKNRSNLKDVLNTNNGQIMTNDKILNEASIWSYQYLRFFDIINNLPKKEFTSLGELENFDLVVGPQVLDKKYYVLYNATDNGDYTIGTNLKGDKVKIESLLTRPLYENDKMNSFTEFESSDQTTFIIFPYTNDAKLIDINEISSNFPNAYDYFLYVNENSTNQFRKKEQEFHGYTRVQNLQYGNTPKVFMPMTSKRVVASFSNIEIFGDNSNITSFISKKNEIAKLKSYTIIFNSELFTIITTPLSGEARGGYRKMNKQFIETVPVPILSESEINYLSSLYDEIVLSIKNLKKSYGDSSKVFYKELEDLQNNQNRWVYNKYNYSEEELNKLKENINLSDLDWLKLDYEEFV